MCFRFTLASPDLHVAADRRNYTRIVKTESNLNAPAGGLDQPFHAAIAQLTGGISPVSVNFAYTDWLQHLALSPDKQLELVMQGMRKWQILFALGAQSVLGATVPAEVEPLPQGKRFTDPAWQRWPFNYYRESLLLTERWWQRATTGTPGLARHHEDVIAFITRQMLDGAAATDFVTTNPLVLERTVREGGANLVRGTVNAAENVQRAPAGAPPIGTECTYVFER
jgi:polyhydroxyalkanoate synthase